MMRINEIVRQANVLKGELLKNFDEVECSWVRDCSGIKESYITVRKDNTVYRMGFNCNIYDYNAKALALYVLKNKDDDNVSKRKITENETLIKRLIDKHELECAYVRLDDGCLIGDGYEIELATSDIFNRDNKLTIFSEDCQEVFILDLEEDTLEFVESEIEEDFGSANNYRLFTEPQTIDSIILDVIHSEEIEEEGKLDYIDQFKPFSKKGLSASWAISNDVFEDFRGYIIVDKDNNVVDRIAY